MNTIILIIALLVKNLFMLIILLCLKNLNQVIKLVNFKELQNRISRIIRLWSLFCPVRVYASLDFLLIHLENYFLSLCAFCLFCQLHVEFDVIFINFITFGQSLFGHVICFFVLTYEKQFVNFIKI